MDNACPVSNLDDLGVKEIEEVVREDVFWRGCTAGLGTPLELHGYSAIIGKHISTHVGGNREEGGRRKKNIQNIGNSWFFPVRRWRTWGLYYIGFFVITRRV